MKKQTYNRLKEIHERFHRAAAKAIRAATRKGEPVEFKTSHINYRAWPSGSVTKLDGNGDSTHTMIQRPPTLLLVVASTALTAALRCRLESGLFGSSIEEVAERLLCEACRGKIVVQ